MINKFKVTFVVSLLFILILLTCNFNEISLPNLKLAIDYNRFLSSFDDQLYELNENGILTVTLCRLEGDGTFGFRDFYNENGIIQKCKFKENSIKLSQKEKLIIYDLIVNLINKESIKKETILPNDNFSTSAAVYIQIDGEIPYYCAYIEDYKTSKESRYFSSEILDLTYRFIDYVPIKPRSEWIMGKSPEDKFTGGIIQIDGITTHSHKWK